MVILHLTPSTHSLDPGDQPAGCFSMLGGHRLRVPLTDGNGWTLSTGPLKHPLAQLRLFRPAGTIASMISNNDAHLKILNHMVEYFMLFVEDGLEESQVDELVDEHSYLAEVLLESMGLEIISVEDDKINVTLSLQDVAVFIDAKLEAEEPFVEDSTS